MASHIYSSTSPVKLQILGSTAYLHGRKSPQTGFGRAEAFKEFLSTSPASRTGGQEEVEVHASLLKKMLSFAICSEVDILV